MPFERLFAVMTFRSSSSITHALTSTGLSRRHFLALSGAAAASAATWSAGRSVSAAQVNAPDTLNMDYAYYNPSSLVLKRYGWIEELLPALSVQVTSLSGSSSSIQP